VDKKQYKNIDEYIAGFPENIQAILQNLRRVIHEAAPEAQETISYGMPAFRLNGIVVYFAAFKDHIGFFPTSSGVSAFARELAPYDTSKGTIRFPLDEPIPVNLIKKIVKFRAQENLNKKKK
jgi:uncharacterized protein YdhG (YjbR/CyaY superfamily)